MDKPNNQSTLKYMRAYIRANKLNDKPIKLNMKREDTIKHLRKLDHWDSSVDDVEKPKKTDGIDKAKGTSQKRVMVGKEEPAKKRLDEYVKLHTLYIDTFDDKGLSKFSTFKSAKSDSDKLLKRMDDLVEPISQILISDYIEKNQKVIGLKKKVKDLEQSLEERFNKLPKKKKPAKPKGKNVSQKVLAIEHTIKNVDPPKKADQPKPPSVKVKERDILNRQYKNKYNKTIYQILKEYDPRMSSVEKAKALSKDEINKTAKKIRIKLHPDKGGDEKEFKKANEAIEILLDTIK